MRTRLWRNTLLRCDCAGYWFPHRKTSGSCHQRPNQLKAVLCKARREGEKDLLQVIANFTFDNPGQLVDPNQIPF